MEEARKGETMKIAATVVFVIVSSMSGVSAEAEGPRLAITAPEKISMKDDLGTENSKWKFVAGRWVRRASGGRQVLAQTAETQPWAVAILEDQKFDDVDVTVRFRPVSGKEDASGGIILRAKDGRNYLVVRANALENNFRLYTMVNGKRSTIASAKVTEPKLGEWHTIRVVAKGSRIQAYLDNALLLDHEDKTFVGGWVGLWTKADSVTEFADLAIVGTPTK
jgi:3-keto-disaccharide hydrolase